MMVRDLGEFEQGECWNGMLEGLYWFYFIGVILLLGLFYCFGSDSVGMKRDRNIGLINQF